ncbi:hypothetical protein ES703_125784 [subsurface metagenome]
MFGENAQNNRYQGKSDRRLKKQGHVTGVTLKIANGNDTVTLNVTTQKGRNVTVSVAVRITESVPQSRPEPIPESQLNEKKCFEKSECSNAVSELSKAYCQKKGWTVFVS